MHPADIVFGGVGGRAWLALMLLLGTGLFAYIMVRRIRLMTLGEYEHRFDRWGRRIAHTLSYFLGQRGMFKDPVPGLMHALIFWGFLVYAIRTLTLFIAGFNPALEIPLTWWGNIYFGTKDAFALLVSLGCLYWLHQRWIAKRPRLTLSWEGPFILMLILSLMITDLLVDGAQIAMMGENPRGAWAFAGAATGSILQGLGLSLEALKGIFLGSWWLHLGLILVFLNFLPLGKHFHVITALFNVFFYKAEPQGRMSKLDVEGAFEREETLGLQTIKDLTIHDFLDLYSCTECGRCEEECPAHHSGKVLSPKEIILELRDHAYREYPLFGKPQTNHDVVVPISVHPDEIWACTTCMACVEACPVSINQLDKILAMRRNEVMMKDDYPTHFTDVFKGYDGRGNPWNMTPDVRLEWAKGLEVPIMSEIAANGGNLDDIEYLFFVGCGTAFEPRNHNVARSLVKILNQAGISFAVLGEEETCNGDAARRIGHEYLFQLQAEQLIETFSSYNVSKILTLCPHCFNTFANEYPDFGGHYEVVHHTQLIDGLVGEGRIKLTKELKRTITYHDSCYLGRYNGVYDPQRRTIDALPGAERVEMERSREKGMCCGAGGGLMWVEEEPGKEVNARRLEQALAVTPEILATACPFCMIMMEDGIKNRNVPLEDKDIAELVAEAMEERSASGASSTG